MYEEEWRFSDSSDFDIMLTDDDLDPFPKSADLPISADIEINRTFVERFSAANQTG